MTSLPPVPFFALDREYSELREPMLAAIDRALATGQLLQGPAVSELEERIAAATQRRHAVAVNSCTDAIFFALVASGIGAGDEVLVPDYTFAATAAAVLRTGATPVFIDIDDEWALDVDLAEAAVTERTAAIVYVHLFGRMGNAERATAFADRHGLLLVEDAAQVFGAERAGRPAGSFGHASCLSFDPTKVVGALGSGGAVLTDDDATAEAARALRYHGRVGREFTRLGYNSQLPTVAAAALLVKLGALEGWLTRRRAIAARYSEVLSRAGAQPPDAGSGRDHIFHKFVVRTAERDLLAEELHSRNVETMIHYPYRIHELPFVQAAPHRVVENGTAAAASNEVLSLPIHPQLRADEVERVLEGVAAFADRLGVTTG